MAPYLSLLLLFAYASTGSSDPNSCRGRCGEGYYRGSLCQCDYECLGLNECCTDFTQLCTTKDSCKGRCGEPFHRGNPCHCDIDCVSYTQCCPDYENMCLVEETSNEEMTNDEGIGEAEEVTTPEDESESTPSEGLDASSTLPADENPIESPSSTATEGPTNSESTEGPTSTKPEGPTSLEPTEGSSSTTPEGPSSSEPVLEPTELPSIAAPTEGPISSETTEDQPSAAPTEGPPVPATTVGPTSSEPTEPPSSAATTEGPTSSETTDGPSSAATTESPTFSETTEGPSTTAPTDVPLSAEPTDVPLSAEPTDGPSSTAQTLGLPSAAPAEGPSSLMPTENPTSTGPTSQSEEPKESLKDPITTPVPKKTLSTPAPVKPTKKPIKPSVDNDKSEPKEPLKDPTDLVPIKLEEKPLKPSSDKNGKTDSNKDYQADDYDTNLCSGRPVSGLTTLRNGTIVVFRGHYFWTLDKQRNPDPPQLITQVWGIPSPIDTVYTRCNCQGKTYFFKGRNYWRFENGMMDPGFPKPISQGFGQIGHITAALSIPEYRSRKESVIFFKRGGMAQKYTYQVTPKCGKKPRISVYTVRTRARRQADAALGQVISISKTWKGFPTVVTSSVSVPSRVKEGYKYYVFSPNKYYSMKMEREKPVILKPAVGPKENSATSFFKCPEKLRH
ncbi:proteoglycan 4b isoform X2 [Puntigrus tetrazona]|uniref:proteoglycan 4b isoform X2 n=1 Tax=Puntigrus tetrazona TaxID=1606681 RepID=UPI001C8AE9D4|nr:proteoglycan 4b isoform X2 [Puntigrus tetrazona]